MLSQEEMKRMAAEKAVELVPENEYIGIGTGSTVNLFVEALGKSGKKIKGAVATSKRTSELMAKCGIPEVQLSEVSKLAIYVDGADEINHTLQMIKGGGAALLAEKIVASASEQFVCIADESKYVSRLGKFPLPVEVIPLSRSLVSRRLVALGGNPELRLDCTTASRPPNCRCAQLGFVQTLNHGRRVEQNSGRGGKRLVCPPSGRCAGVGYAKRRGSFEDTLK